MKRVRWNSVRVRLTLWNAGLLALLLAGSGIALCYRVQADLMRSVDRDLAQQADGMATGWARHFDERHRPRPREDAPPFRLGHPPGGRAPGPTTGSTARPGRPGPPGRPLRPRMRTAAGIWCGRAC